MPRNACLLTFDDGFIDHYATVYPRLAARGIRGSFYVVPAAAVLEHQALDVHKIHRILAAEADHTRVKDALLSLLSRFRETRELPSNAALYATYGKPSRFDGPDIVFIKKMLQVGLPEDIRRHIGAELFARFVTPDEETFAKDLYVSVPLLQNMLAAGMTVGGHGYTHRWLGTLGRREQETEIARTHAFLEEVYGTLPGDWVMCYPYGSYNTDTLEILRRCGCPLGLTTRVGLADLKSPLELVRIDTNDLPCDVDAPPCLWTQRIQAGAV